MIEQSSTRFDISGDDFSEWLCTKDTFRTYLKLDYKDENLVEIPVMTEVLAIFGFILSRAWSYDRYY